MPRGASRRPCASARAMLAPRICGRHCAARPFSRRSIGSSSATVTAGATSTDWSLPRYKDDPTPICRRSARTSEAGAADSAATVARQEQAAATRGPRSSGACRGGSAATHAAGRQRADPARSSGTTCGANRCAPISSRLLALLRAGIWRWRNASWSAAGSRATTISCCTSGDRGSRSAAKRRRTACARSSPSARPSASATRRFEMPLLMRRVGAASLIRMAGVSGGGEDGGSRVRPVSGGCVEGEVVVVRDPAISAA